MVSSDGLAEKAIFELSDGLRIESMLLRPSPRRRTVCLSSQAGCAMGCGFCATGLMGLARDLSPEEIAGQFAFWKERLRGRGEEGPQNAVFMGMGEPLAAYDSVAESLRLLLEPKGFGLGPSRICVSTAGVAPALDRLAREFPKVRLALSLHAAEDSLRSRLVPLNRRYPLTRLAESLRAMAAAGRKVFLEYVLLDGVNDRPADSRALIDYLRLIGPAELLHVNLIRFNPNPTAYRPTPEPRARGFQAALRAGGLRVTVRRNLGGDIAGACGQLLA